MEAGGKKVTLDCLVLCSSSRMVALQSYWAANWPTIKISSSKYENLLSLFGFKILKSKSNCFVPSVNPMALIQFCISTSVSVFLSIVSFFLNSIVSCELRFFFSTYSLIYSIIFLSSSSRILSVILVDFVLSFLMSCLKRL